MSKILRVFLILTFYYFGCTNLMAQPDNDECSNAIALNTVNGGCFFNATMVNATQSLAAANCNSTLVQDVWFSFVADSVFHRVSVSPSSGIDAVLEVRKGNSCNGTFVACIDEGGGDGAVENLNLSNLEIGTTYFVRVYDFTGSGFKPSTWTLDICVSGFAPSEPPEIQLVTPKGGEQFEAGSIVTIQAEVQGVISGKELQFSTDNGVNWEVIWQSSSPNPSFQYDWIVPSINAENCLIKAIVFQSGEAFEAVNEQIFTITTNPNPTFQLGQELTHLYWPFYNPETIPISDFHVPSEWQNQENGILITKDDVTNIWFFFNDHYWQSSGRWHHSGDNCFAQDWNFINGGNSDCRMYFFSPMAGKILFKKDACLNFNCNNPTCTSGCGNYIVVQSTEDPTFAYRACHFSELNSAVEVGDNIEAGDFIARVGNEGSSSAAHVHFVLYKNLTIEDLNVLGSGATLSSNSNQNIDPNNITDLCFDKAANFRFDVPLNPMTTNIPTVFYEPVYKIKLYPNPNEGPFKLTVNATAHQFMQVEIFDGIGRSVFVENRKKYSAGTIININLEGINTGVYFVRMRLDQELVTTKFIRR